MRYKIPTKRWVVISLLALLLLSIGFICFAVLQDTKTITIHGTIKDPTTVNIAVAPETIELAEPVEIKKQQITPIKITNLGTAPTAVVFGYVSSELVRIDKIEWDYNGEHGYLGNNYLNPNESRVVNVYWTVITGGNTQPFEFSIDIIGGKIN